MGKRYVLRREQIINKSIEETWNFFSTPENLDALTPSNMGFEILTARPIPRMYEGQIIEYHVKPILNIPLHWKTEIVNVNEPYSFIDTQIKGPYKVWEHTHSFTAINKYQTNMVDIVEYVLPFGPLAHIAHPLYVKKRLDEIFDYRYEKVKSLLN